ncbi:MAG TPA: hypothetical protein P5081_14015 [Phycisphaerae bacterium]|nr:hypothetical protein [Phycisphaerae bacterium]HRW53987.1 hypothetical protein [Phycisphaerae bacterium]
MSTNWYLYSFDESLWNSIFGSGAPEHVKALSAFLTDEQNFDFEDPEVAEEVARKLISHGFNAEQFDDEEVEIVECVPSAVVHSGDTLSVDAKAESPEGTTWQMLQELMRRAEGRVESKMIRLLSNGRSLLGPDYEDAEYVILSPDEVRSLRAELEQIVGLDAEWSHPDFAPYIQNELVAPIQSIAATGRALAVMIG